MAEGEGTRADVSDEDRLTSLTPVPRRPALRRGLPQRRAAVRGRGERRAPPDRAWGASCPADPRARAPPPRAQHEAPCHAGGAISTSAPGCRAAPRPCHGPRNTAWTRTSACTRSPSGLGNDARAGHPRTVTAPATPSSMRNGPEKRSVATLTNRRSASQPGKRRCGATRYSPTGTESRCSGQRLTLAFLVSVIAQLSVPGPSTWLRPMRVTTGSPGTANCARQESFVQSTVNRPDGPQSGPPQASRTSATGSPHRPACRTACRTAARHLVLTASDAWDVPPGDRRTVRSVSSDTIAGSVCRRNVPNRLDPSIGVGARFECALVAIKNARKTRTCRRARFRRPCRCDRSREQMQHVGRRQPDGMLNGSACRVRGDWHRRPSGSDVDCGQHAVATRWQCGVQLGKERWDMARLSIHRAAHESPRHPGRARHRRNAWGCGECAV
jgi:hypothetical protein